MGDFAAPAAAANGSSICINSSLNSSLGGAGIGVNNTPNSTPAAPSSNHPAAGGCGGGGPGGSSAVVPKHSTVVERLRQRIEGCRRHHVNCENRYQQAQVEQLELERRDTVSLYQRTLEQRAKKSGAGTGKQQHPSKPQQDAEAASAEQRNHTLIMLQETVKRKLEGARSPLNGDQQNGACDGSFSPTNKRLRKDIPTGMEAINSLPNNMPLPSASPLHQLDLKPSLPLQNSGTHTPGLLEDLNKNGRLPEIKLPVNGCSDLEDSFAILQSKDLKQEPLDDPTCIDTSETSLSNQNKLFSDINLNDQEWQELIDELANTVPEDDIQDLFNEDFEEKKEPEFSQAAAETPLSQESTSVKSDPSHSPFAHVSMGSPQARPSSSGPPFSSVSTATSLPSVASTPAAPNPASSPANCAVPSPQTPNQAHTPGQGPPRPGNGYLLNPAAVTVAGSGTGPVAVPSSDMSPAEQLKQMAAQQQQRAKLMQQKQQQQQQQHSNQTSSWSPLRPPSSPYGAAFPAEKPNSPMMYPQAFNNQNPIVPPMANNLQKTTMNNYLPQNHINIINHQPNNLGTNSLNKQHSILTYGNTKPLTHFNADLSQRMTPPMANPNKNPLMPYIQPQQQQQQPPQQPPQQQPPPPPQLQAPRAHLSEEQKRMLLMKQKGVMNQPMAYAALPSHGQEPHPVGLPRTTGPLQSSVPPGSSSMVSGASPAGPGFLGSQPQAAIMKQMLIDQRAQLMEQQKQQFLREQRQQQQQQQQQQILAEQQLQQSHLPRQHLQQQRNPYPVQQVNQFQGSPQDIAAVRSQAALQSMRTSRLMAQNAGMMGMGPSQNPGTMATAAAQSEMGLAPYSTTPTSQPGMYSMSTGMTQMLQHPNQSGMSITHNQAQGPRQPASGQGVGMVSGFGQSMLVNSALTQQHQQMKGPVGQALPRPQAPPRLQSIMGTVQQGAQSWQQRSLQGMPGRTSGELGPFNNGASYPLQAGQPRLTKQHFPQGLSQSVMDANTGTVRTLNPAAMGRQMMPPLPGQQGTSQARPMVMSGLNQGVPGMPAFSQPPAQQQMPSGSFAPSSQSQAYERNPPQDMPYNYSEGAGASFPGLPDSADLVDSIIKSGPGDEWMQELDELFGNP
ncbi:mastermind-like protein 3 isoform X1 [Marmota marmota marmota]|uniref:Mastermind like transcriptional coactivator 3 n=1 Tax=Marmota marmota marmota TaxID=9994 RepID=A0A8C5ZRE8_MARMA|nr:mastermind-like protein 3 isoform X1 [Marmota marmota marmota]